VPDAHGPGDQSGHSVPGQERLQIIDLAVLHRALRQDDDIDGLDLVLGDEHPVHEIQIEPLGRDELEEPEGVISKLLQRPGHRAEV
jgi:hypothetical protein